MDTYLIPDNHIILLAEHSCKPRAISVYCDIAEDRHLDICIHRFLTQNKDNYMLECLIKTVFQQRILFPIICSQ